MIVYANLHILQYIGKWPLSEEGAILPHSPHFAKRREEKYVKAVPRSAESLGSEFAIVKASLPISLRIIKGTETCYEKITTKIMEIFTIKLFAKIIKEQIFTSLLIIFTVI